MKALPTLTSSLALSVILLTAQAQTPATSPDIPTQPKPAAKMAKGTTGAKGSKTLGQKWLDNSKPTDMLVPPPPPSRPVKK